MSATMPCHRGRLTIPNTNVSNAAIIEIKTKRPASFPVINRYFDFTYIIVISAITALT